MKILEKTFKQMPRIFTSNAFNKKAVENGYPRYLIKNNGTAWFLHKYADNDEERTKTWTKKAKDIVLDISAFSNISKSNMYRFSSIQEIIAFLKSKGYKIMKPVSEWVEL